MKGGKGVSLNRKRETKKLEWIKNKKKEGKAVMMVTKKTLEIKNIKGKKTGRTIVLELSHHECKNGHSHVHFILCCFSLTHFVDVFKFCTFKYSNF